MTIVMSIAVTATSSATAPASRSGAERRQRVDQLCGPDRSFVCPSLIGRVQSADDDTTVGDCRESSCRSNKRRGHRASAKERELDSTLADHDRSHSRDRYRTHLSTEVASSRRHGVVRNRSEWTGVARGELDGGSRCVARERMAAQAKKIQPIV